MARTSRADIGLRLRFKNSGPAGVRPPAPGGPAVASRERRRPRSPTRAPAVPWTPCLAPGHAAPSEIEVLGPQRGHLAHAQPGAVQQLQDRPVAQARSRARSDRRVVRIAGTLHEAGRLAGAQAPSAAGSRPSAGRATARGRARSARRRRPIDRRYGSRRRGARSRRARNRARAAGRGTGAASRGRRPRASDASGAGRSRGGSDRSGTRPGCSAERCRSQPQMRGERVDQRPLGSRGAHGHRMRATRILSRHAGGSGRCQGVSSQRPAVRRNHPDGRRPPSAGGRQTPRAPRVGEALPRFG